ncbi:hypothetical protein FOZ63_018870 [Perkinsus olseni]|uniref:Uncharacterized protein n=1 Tax=Perkinsus olseni TaxID=32597 RepID=A0A7J6U6Z9_PEROL|nr:hypothetical protein FOZ63_018870 [Perkinsus olseni]KAF4753333.1 hypothetical protein FOZ62_029955 [Perkinsus olseni]
MSLTLSPAMVERVLRRCEEVLAGVGMEATPFVVDWYNDFRLEVAADMPQLIEVSGRNRLGLVCVSNKDFFRSEVERSRLYRVSNGSALEGTAVTEELCLDAGEKSLVLDVSWAEGGIELWGQRKFDFVAEASDDVGRMLKPPRLSSRCFLAPVLGRLLVEEIGCDGFFIRVMNVDKPPFLHFNLSSGGSVVRSKEWSPTASVVSPSEGRVCPAQARAIVKCVRYLKLG